MDSILDPGPQLPVKQLHNSHANREFRKLCRRQLSLRTTSRFRRLATIDHLHRSFKLKEIPNTVEMAQHHFRLTSNKKMQALARDNASSKTEIH